MPRSKLRVLKGWIEDDGKIRQDHSVAKLSNQRLQEDMFRQIDSLNSLRCFRSAEKTFDIQAAKKESEYMLNQYKVMCSTRGLWEKTLFTHSKTLRESRSAHLQQRNSVHAIPVSRVQEQTKRPKSRLSVQFLSSKDERPDRRGERKSSKYMSEDENESIRRVRLESDSSVAMSVDSDTPSQIQQKSFVINSKSEEEFVNPYRNWVMRRKRVLSAFLPREQIPINGRFEKIDRNRFDSGDDEEEDKHEAHRQRQMSLSTDQATSLSRQGGSKSAHHRRPLTSSSSSCGRSFQQLKQLVHIDSLSRAQTATVRHSKLHHCLMEEQARKQQIQSRVTQFYTTIDSLISETNDALKGTQLNPSNPNSIVQLNLTQIE